MEDNIIVEEYLNHFFTYSELANYLNLDEDRVRKVLDHLEGNIASLVSDHKSNIDKYNKGKFVINIHSDIDSKVYEVAKYMVEHNSSIRDTAKTFKMGKTTIGNYINKRLPNVSIKLYKEVFDLIQSRKSLSINYKEHQTRLYKEIECLEKGMTIEEISEAIGTSRNTVQRDLANRTKNISASLNERIKDQLYDNQMRMNR